MTIFQNALDRWVHHDGTTYQYFDTEQEAQMAEQLQVVGETPAEYEIAATVTGQLLPQLRNALLALTSLRMAWYANDLPDMIDDALAAVAAIEAATEEAPTTLTEADTLIAGLPVSAWIAWGAVLTSLQAWLDTSLEDIGATPTTILSKRYTRRA